MDFSWHMGLLLIFSEMRKHNVARRAHLQARPDAPLPLFGTGSQAQWFRKFGSGAVLKSTAVVIRPLWETVGMKKKLRPKGEWQAIGMQEVRLEKGSPEKLRMRARQLRDHAERLSREAEELEERAAVAEKGRTTK
jgi:hypothetical protein